MVCLGYWAFKAARTQADAITGLFCWRQMARWFPRGLSNPRVNFKARRLKAFGMRDLAFLAGYLALFPMALASPLIAVMVVVWMSFLAPYNYLYGIANSLPLYMTSCVLMVVSSCLNPKNLTFRATPLHLLMILFLVQGAISSAASPLSVSWDMLILLSKIVFLCFMVMLVVRNRLEIHTALLVVMLGLGFHAVVEGLKTIASGGAHIVTGIPQHRRQ